MIDGLLRSTYRLRLAAPALLLVLLACPCLPFCFPPSANGNANAKATLVPSSHLASPLFGAAPSNSFLANFITSTLPPNRAQSTRFPPEPNGFLHLGHVKAATLNYEIAKRYNGNFTLRLDDTNPSNSYDSFSGAILEDVNWCLSAFPSFSPILPSEVRRTSMHFDRLHAFASLLVSTGQAYADDSSPEELRAARGSLTSPGVPTPARFLPISHSQSVWSNSLLSPTGDTGETKTCVLRLRLDLSSPNPHLRDPVIYRRVGSNLLPTYDFSHPLVDWFEGVTLSLCSLEFAPHRSLYNLLLKMYAELWLVPVVPVSARLASSLICLLARSLACYLLTYLLLLVSLP